MKILRRIHQFLMTDRAGWWAALGLTIEVLVIGIASAVGSIADRFGPIAGVVAIWVHFSAIVMVVRRWPKRSEDRCAFCKRREAVLTVTLSAGRKRQELGACDPCARSLVDRLAPESTGTQFEFEDGTTLSTGSFAREDG